MKMTCPRCSGCASLAPERGGVASLVTSPPRPRRPAGPRGTGRWGGRRSVPVAHTRPGTACPEAVGSPVRVRVGYAAPSAQPLADHLGDAVALHGDAVERVGHLHRAFLMGDDDQLGGLLELLHDADEPLE